MISLNATPALFSIQPVTAIKHATIDQVAEEVIEIYMVLKGQVTFINKQLKVLLQSNNLYCIQYSKHNRVEVNRGAEGYVIRFNRTLLYSGDREFYYSHFPAFNVLVQRGELLHTQPSFWREGKKLCEMMQKEFAANNSFKWQILGGLLSIFLLKLMRMSKAFLLHADSKREDVVVRQFNTLLELNFKTIKKVSDYAALLYITPGRLNQVLKQATGNSAGFHIRQRIVVEAVRHARLSGASMKEVAYELGFSDNAHFSKFFKKVVGKNFTDIRVTTSLLNYNAINRLD